MKKIVSFLLAIALVCSLGMTVFAAAAGTVYEDEVDVMIDIYDDGTVEFLYELPHQPLWVEMYIFTEDQIPETGAVEGMMDESLKDYRLLKTETDDQFMQEGRFVGPSYDVADSVYIFEDGVTYYIYFGACDGASWWYYSTPFVLEYEATGAPVTKEPTETPGGTTTTVPGGTTTAPNGTTTAPGGDTDPAGLDTWVIVAIAVAAVAIVAVIVVVVVKKKKKKD